MSFQPNLCFVFFFYAQIYFSYVLANFPKIENILAFRGKFFFGIQDKKTPEFHHFRP